MKAAFFSAASVMSSAIASLWSADSAASGMASAARAVRLVVGDASMPGMVSSSGSATCASPDGAVGRREWSAVAVGESSGMFSATC
jgi:hypothetical protein